MTNSDEFDPPGQEATVMSSVDDKFSVGLWRRDVQRRHFERPYHEIAFILEGEVEITEEDGEVHIARAGDILITPKGSQGLWKTSRRSGSNLGDLRGARPGPRPLHRPGRLLKDGGSRRPPAGGPAQPGRPPG